MTAPQAELLMAAIAHVATEFEPFREGWPGITENSAEVDEIKGGAKAFAHELANAVRALHELQPEVVARWRRT